MLSLNIINEINTMLSYEFITRALIVGIIVSICASLLGVSLVLKRYSMIGDGLSHVAFGALAIATVLNISPLYFSIPVVILIAFLLLNLKDSSKIKGDSAIAIISAGSMAIGVMFISVTIGINIDICNYLFGSILAMRYADVILSVILGIIVLLIFILFYNRIFAVTFDESFASATGLKVKMYNLLIAVLTAITIVLGMRLMGSLLIASLIIFPAITSMQIFKNFKSVIISAAIISVTCFITGFFISYLYATPVGASIVCVDLIVLALFSLIAFIKRRVAI